MGSKFKPNDGDLLFATIPSVGQLMPPTSLARFIDNYVDSFDADEYKRLYSQRGASSYNPLSLLKVILLAYLNNIYRLKDIALVARFDSRYGYYLGFSYPSLSTIRRFCVKRLGANKLKVIYTDLLRQLLNRRLILIARQSVVGLKSVPPEYVVLPNPERIGQRVTHRAINLIADHAVANLKTKK